MLAAIWWFDVPLRGGLVPLYLGLVFFVTAVTGIGLMISSLAVTQQQALLGAFLFMVPSIILSGFATPIANMPDFVQDLTLINPMRYFLVVVRGVFLEGATMRSLLPQYLADGADRSGQPGRGGLAVQTPQLNPSSQWPVGLALNHSKPCGCSNVSSGS